MPSLSELMTAMPTATQGWAAEENRQADLASLAAQTQGQQIQNQQGQAELEKFQADQELVDLNRQLDIMDAQYKSTPEYQEKRQKLAGLDLSSQVSAAEKQEMQGMLDTFTPVIQAIRSGDSAGLANAVASIQQSPYLQEALQDPQMGPLVQGALQGDPQAMHQLIATHEDLSDILSAPGARAAQAEMSMKQFESGLTMDEQAAKERAMAKRTLAEKKVEGEYDLAKQGMAGDATVAAAGIKADKPMTQKERLAVEEAKDKSATRIMQGAFPEEFAAYTGEGGNWFSDMFGDSPNPELYEEVRTQVKHLTAAVAAGGMTEPAAVQLLRRAYGPDLKAVESEKQQAKYDDWYERAVKHNPNVDPEIIKRQGIASGKLPRGYK